MLTVNPSSSTWTGVFAGPVEDVAVRPSAAVLQRLPEVPMVEGDVGDDAGLEQSVEQRS
jgi:hypothetical protein